MCRSCGGERRLHACQRCIPGEYLLYPLCFLCFLCFLYLPRYTYYARCLQILAAPFATVGSIGVVGGAPNLHKLLERGGVEFVQRTAGKHKRSINVLTPNTDEGLQKFEDELQLIHSAFISHVSTHRPTVDAAEASGPAADTPRSLALPPLHHAPSPCREDGRSTPRSGGWGQAHTWTPSEPRPTQTPFPSRPAPPRPPTNSIL